MKLFCLKNKKYTAGLLFLSLFLFLFFPNKTHAINLDWPQFHYDAQRAGFNPNETQINPTNVSNLQLAWTKEILPNATTGLLTASSVISNGILYLGSGTGYPYFYAIDVNTGLQLWSASTIGNINSTAAVVNGKVYVTDNAFGVYAFDAYTGQQIWHRGFSFSGSNYLPNSVLVVNETVYVAQLQSSNFGGTLWALNANNGNTVWAISLPTLTSSPSFTNININGVQTPVIYQCINGFSDGYVNAFKANTGELLWSTHTRCRVSSPAIYNGIVYIGSDDGSLYALDAATGSIVWISSTTHSSIDATPAVVNGVVYVGGQSGSMYAYNAQNGNLIWSTPIGAIQSSAAVANGVVYLGTISNFGLYALDASNGNVLWSYSTPRKITASPAVSNGFVYVSADRADGIIAGPLYAFHLSDLISPSTSITQNPQANVNGWNNTDVNITLNATDNNGGSGVKEIHYTVNSGGEQVVSGDSTSFIVSTEGTNTITYWSVDNAGNTEQTNTYSLKIDKTNPIITINSPTEGATYLLNQPITANWNVSDSLSGLTSSVGTVPSGQNIDTSTVGSHSFTVSATDNAGNTATKTVNYYVHYNFGGFLAPVSNNGKVFKTGGTIPVKFQLTDFNGNYVTNAVVNLYVAKITNDIVGTDEATTSTSNADAENQFRYDSSNNQYIYNLATQSSPLGQSGTYQLKASLDDGSFYTATVSLK